VRIGDLIDADVGARDARHQRGDAAAVAVGRELLERDGQGVRGRERHAKAARILQGLREARAQIRGALAEELRRSPGLTLKPNVGQATQWIYFSDQWDPKSPWHDRRVRLAANYAIDRPAINRAELLGFARIIWSIIPSSFEFYWQPPGYAHDGAKAKQLLAEAGYPNGFEAGDYSCDNVSATIGEAVVGYLSTVGIRAKLRPLERAAFNRGYAEKKHKGLIQKILDFIF